MDRSVLTCLRLSMTKKCDIIFVNFTHKLEGKRGDMRAASTHKATRRSEITVG